MSNPIKGETPLKLADGREYTLVMDHEALIAAEQVYGKPLELVMADAKQGFIGAIRSLLYGGLQAKHPGATLAAASEMFFADTDAVSAAMSAAIEAAFPKAEGETSGNAPTGKKQGGKRSGANGAKQG